MIEFYYNNARPNNYLELEELLGKKYLQLTLEFPDESIKFNWIGSSWSIAAPDSVLHRMNILDNELKAFIELALEGQWELEYDTPTQYLHFIPSTNNDRNGKVILAYSPDFVVNRQELEYELILVMDNIMFINFIVNTTKQTLQYKIHLLRSVSGILWMDDSNGKYLHYKRFQPQIEIL